MKRIFTCLIFGFISTFLHANDTIPPTIKLNGASPFIQEFKTPYNELGVSTSDNYWPPSTITTQRKGSVNVNVLGEYTLWYIATDPSGNKDSISRLVKVVDISKPIIDLLGVYEVNLQRWKVYVDPPVALLDNNNSDAEMRPFLIIKNPLPKNDEGNPFGNIPGRYTITYSVKDLDGNQSDFTSRIITVLPESGTGIDQMMNIEYLVSVFPNPSNGRFNLKLAGVQNEDLKITVFDLVGRELQSFVMIKNDLQVQELNLSNQPKGFYILQIQTGESIFSRKIQVN